MNADPLPLDKPSTHFDVNLVPARGANLDLGYQLAQLRGAGRGLMGCLQPKPHCIAHSCIAKLL